MKTWCYQVFPWQPSESRRVCLCQCVCLCVRQQGCTRAQNCDFGLNEMRDDEGEGVWMSTQEALSHSNVVSSLGSETSGTVLVTGWFYLFTCSVTKTHN